MRIAKINTILKRSVNKLFAVENKYHDTNQTAKTREQILDFYNINFLIRFDKTRKMFHSVTWVLNIFLTRTATSTSVQRANSAECIA